MTFYRGLSIFQRVFENHICEDAWQTVTSGVFHYQTDLYHCGHLARECMLYSPVNHSCLVRVCHFKLESIVNRVRKYTESKAATHIFFYVKKKQNIDHDFAIQPTCDCVAGVHSPV